MSQVEASRRGEGLRFIDAALAAFEQACARSGESSYDYRLGPDRMRWRFAGAEMRRLLEPALRHLEIDDGRAPGLTVCVFDSESTATPMPAPPWDGTCYGARGEITGFNDNRLRITYQPGVDMLLAFDAERGIAIYWVPDFRLVPFWEVTFPGRCLVHWYMATGAYQPIHSGAVGDERGGVLIAGMSGSGKSTTTLSCLNSGLKLAGEDYTLAGGDPAWAYSLYSTAKLVPDSLWRFPELQPWISNAGQLETQKALIYLQEKCPEQLTTGFPLRAIVVPKVTGRLETRLAPATVMQALMAMGPTTLLHLQGATEEAMAKMSRLVRSVPVYTLEAGTDLRQIPQVLSTLLDGRRG